MRMEGTPVSGLERFDGESSNNNNNDNARMGRVASVSLIRTQGKRFAGFQRDLPNLLEQGNESFRFEISSDNVKSIRNTLKQIVPSATMTGLMLAAIMHSMCVLVDLRPFLPLVHDTHEINQANGTVTVMESADCWNTMDGGVTDQILAKSLELTQQLRRRIHRGEAHRSALATTTFGRFEEAIPPATIEPGNLVVCRIPVEAKLYTAQRFDG